MSIVVPNLSKEAFCCHDTGRSLLFSRRAFPPLLDEARDITNADEAEVYFSSAIYMVEQRLPMLFCGGVSGCFIGQKVGAICCTDFVLAKKLIGKVVVTDWAWMDECSVDEVVATKVFLSRGVANVVFCTNGVLDHMIIEQLFIQGAVVVKDCQIGSVVLVDARFELLDSSQQVAGKNLFLELHREIGCSDFPAVQLINTRSPSIDARNIDLLTRRHPISVDQLQAAEKLFNALCEAMQDSLINRYNDRGNSWNIARPDQAIASMLIPYCRSCWEPLPNDQRVFGHHAYSASNGTHIEHLFCCICFNTMLARGDLDCPVCQCTFLAEHRSLTLADRWHSEWERNYEELMGLYDLYQYTLAWPSRHGFDYVFKSSAAKPLNIVFAPPIA